MLNLNRECFEILKMLNPNRECFQILKMLNPNRECFWIVKIWNPNWAYLMSLFKRDDLLKDFLKKCFFYIWINKFESHQHNSIWSQLFAHRILGILWSTFETFEMNLEQRLDQLKGILCCQAVKKYLYLSWNDSGYILVKLFNLQCK